MCIHRNSGTALLRTLKCEHLIDKDTASANKYSLPNALGIVYMYVYVHVYVNCFMRCIKFCTQVNNQLDTDMLSAKPLLAVLSNLIRQLQAFPRNAGIILLSGFDL